MATDDFLELLNGSKHSAVHMEMRDVYAVSDEDEGFKRWKNGHRLDEGDRESWWRPWLTLMQDTIARGVVVRRARVISEPVTEYIRYEHSFTFTNVAAGEQVRWLPRRLASDLAFPGNDFWLFDNTAVMFNVWTGDGDWAENGREIRTEPSVIDLCSSSFEAVWGRATPHADYHII
ncbi:hypothetical protein KGQ19_22550 [Catenulispora sp. NL8]|uniref:DUF6879 domain-containing protein n=1 Tax=Catenulispora pinistramenti TaxID=2705254 RepID=A0ABS5KUD2_9ACTN|nr:DUF6879 family protein [Catenulispora pinistramenti]MBS2549648.1 hypothetical protein [Catenulispora pinistramenti]